MKTHWYRPERGEGDTSKFHPCTQGVRPRSRYTTVDDRSLEPVHAVVEVLRSGSTHCTPLIAQTGTPTRVQIVLPGSCWTCPRLGTVSVESFPSRFYVAGDYPT